MNSIKKLCTVVLISAVVALGGCAEVGSTVDMKDGYYAEQRMSETEYTIFISKKTSAILDKLVAHAATAGNIGSGEYDAANEIKNVDVTIATIDESYEDISKIGAAIDYEDARDNLLDQLDSAKEHLESYRDCLSGNYSKSDLEAYASEFKNDFTAIKAF